MSADFFETQRPTLLGIAYRILGSRADAEDAVQDTFVRWQGVDPTTIDNPGAWLTSTCTRRCIDLLRAAHKSRTEYVGTWLPEPLETPETGPEEKATLASSLTTAFLLVLERLTPKERAAYLLHEIFDVSYPDVARSLDIAEPACRKLVSRARANVEREHVRFVPPRSRQEELLAAFTSAVVEGDAARLTQMLADDAELAVDSGGKVPSLRETLHGRSQILAFVSESLRSYWKDYRLHGATLNGAAGFVVRHGDAVVASVSFAYDREGRATRVFIVRNPDKLARLGATEDDRTDRS